MTEYISKSAVIAEIKKRINRNDEKAASYSSNSEHDYLYRVEENVYKSLLSFINTIEVKEVDLEKELDYDDYVNFFKEHPEYNNECWGFEETWTFGQYCYKLGLKAK